MSGKEWKEIIACPICGKTQEAVVVHLEGEPFPDYVHECECGYIVLESEWDALEEQSK